VNITANTPYVVSYSTTVGHYAVDVNAFASGVDNPPLHVATGGGLYKYGGGFPSTAANHNFWVDVVFTAGT
jgi:hypothetical protein